MSEESRAKARALGAFIDASPTPFHACRETARRLEEHGFERLDELSTWERAAGRFYVQRGGTLAAWALPDDLSPAAGFRILGAHTDSPNLRVKPRPDRTSAGFRQLGVEVYGGALLNSWLDRDLGLAGRAHVRDGAGAREVLFHIGRPILCLPQLAIHLNREIKSEGLKLNAQKHMAPVWSLADGDERGFRELLAEELGVAPEAVIAWDAMCTDTLPAALTGADQEFLSAPRIDNLCSCFAAVGALLERVENGREPARHVPLVTLFDHEEVGSTSSRGAQSPLLRDLVERTVLVRGGAREDLHRALADSLCVSADMAHATHPNYKDRHEPEHHLRLNAGPVIKLNANQRYASEGATEAAFQLACEHADVPFQKWVNRTDLSCGSTIGPLTAAAAGIPAVDVGVAQLAMHSARELCGSSDPELLRRALSAFLT